MDELAQSSTTAFHTLDAFNGDLAAEIVHAVESAMEGNNEAWTELVHRRVELSDRLKGQGIEEPSAYTTIRWDPATLLFTTCVELTGDGRPLQLGETLTRERFGRFPHGDGSALGYLLEHIRPNRSVTDNDGKDVYMPSSARLNTLRTDAKNNTEAIPRLRTVSVGCRFTVS